MGLPTLYQFFFFFFLQISKLLLGLCHQVPPLPLYLLLNLLLLFPSHLTKSSIYPSLLLLRKFLLDLDMTKSKSPKVAQWKCSQLNSGLPVWSISVRRTGFRSGTSCSRITKWFSIQSYIYCIIEFWQTILDKA